MEVIDVWKTRLDGSGGGCIHASLEEALDAVRGMAFELCDGQAVTMTIEKSQMTQAEFDALPEFGGY